MRLNPAPVITHPLAADGDAIWTWVNCVEKGRKKANMTTIAHVNKRSARMRKELWKIARTRKESIDEVEMKHKTDNHSDALPTLTQLLSEVTGMSFNNHSE